MDIEEAKEHEWWVVHHKIGQGVTAIFCFWTHNTAPVGVVYTILYGPGNTKKQRAEILGSYVVPWARRLGVRSRINDYLFNYLDCHTIVTQSGSREGGKAFMQNSGYVLDEKLGIWTLTKQDWIQRKQK